MSAQSVFGFCTSACWYWSSSDLARPVKLSVNMADIRITVTYTVSDYLPSLCDSAAVHTDNSMDQQNKN